MMNVNALLRISADQITRFWSTFSRKSYVEPIFIRDGFHDFVLMSADDYANLHDEVVAARAALKLVRWEDGDHGSCDIAQVEFDRRRREGHSVPLKG